ncbi:MAG: TetR/AcrR family transcriptional regulator [Saccharofermentanales bacterium]|jgi:AcrR family transcriptional regulator
MRKQAEKTAHTRRQIIDTFWQKYQENPGQMVSVTEIVKALDINRSTFYYYFQDAPAVLEAIEDELIPTKEVLKDILIIGARKDSSSKQLLQQILYFHNQNQSKFEILLGPNGSRHFMHRLVSAIKQALSELVEPRLGLSELELDYTLELFVGGFLHTLNYITRKTDGLVDAERISHFFYDLFKNGIFGHVLRDKIH